MRLSGPNFSNAVSSLVKFLRDDVRRRSFSEFVRLKAGEAQLILIRQADEKPSAGGAEAAEVALLDVLLPSYVALVWQGKRPERYCICRGDGDSCYGMD